MLLQSGKGHLQVGQRIFDLIFSMHLRCFRWFCLYYKFAKTFINKLSVIMRRLLNATIAADISIFTRLCHAPLRRWIALIVIGCRPTVHSAVRSVQSCSTSEPTWHLCCCCGRCQATATPTTPASSQTALTPIFWFRKQAITKIRPLPRTMRFSAFYAAHREASNDANSCSIRVTDSTQCRVD